MPQRRPPLRRLDPDDGAVLTIAKRRATPTIFEHARRLTLLTLPPLRGLLTIRPR
jgi:hypothetical protein